MVLIVKQLFSEELNNVKVDYKLIIINYVNVAKPSQYATIVCFTMLYCCIVCIHNVDHCDSSDRVGLLYQAYLYYKKPTDCLLELNP